MKIALAQINATVGDIRGNVERILGAYRRALAAGAELVLFPEQAVGGYPPRDLLEQPDFVRANLAALKRLARAAGDRGMVVGYVDVNRARVGKRFFNAAALLWRGRTAARRFKTLLPTYDVFDEGRYFEPARENPAFLYRGVRLGLTICEDAWNDEHFWPRRLYAADPVARQAREGARILLNIAASPYERGKVAFRRRMLASHARRARRPVLYGAMVGGNDELIFDGNSFALDGRGRLLAKARGFAEDLVVVDTAARGAAAPAPEPPEIAQIHDALVLGVADYLRKCGFSEALVGLSGGIDSAVVCALAARALGPGRVTGVALPSPYSSAGSLRDAAALARNLGVRFKRIPIAGAYRAMLSALGPGFGRGRPGLPEQNLQARVRGNLLMALSNKTGALLLSTGNKSELSVGYCTLYGDMSGGLAVIADLPKTTVYELARWINREGELIPRASIAKAPSAELAPGQKDRDDLPSYRVLDAVMRAYVEEGLDARAIVRRGFNPAVVADILRRIDSNEYKRRQAPPVLRLSRKAFGVGRRMPIAAKSLVPGSSH